MLLEIAALNGACAAALDSGRLEAWPGFFLEQCLYKVTTAENFEKGYQAGLIYADSRAMLEDRIAALREANIYERQRYRHILGLPSIVDETKGPLTAETSFKSPLTAETSFKSPLTAETSFKSPVTAETSFKSPVTAETSFKGPLTAETSSKGPVTAETSFIVVRTMRDGHMTIFAAGVYLDRLQRDRTGAWRYAERIVVCDSQRFDTLLAIPL